MGGAYMTPAAASFETASRALVEGFEPDAVALARFLAGEGREVTIAGRGLATDDVRALADLGVRIRECANLDADPGEHDEAFLDVWTPEVATRVRRLRASGCRVRCLADLVLERARIPTIGVTGTAGKTTTATLVAALLRQTGADVRLGTARASNLWPTAELLPPPPDGFLVVELTSSHLCFMTTSPTVAVITSFWPDHIELHGSLARYRAAKETIVRHQTGADAAVVNADDADATAIGRLSPGRLFSFSAKGEVERGAFRAGDRIVLRDAGEDEMVPLPGGLDEPRLLALLAGAAATVAVGRRPSELDELPQPPFRARVVGHRGATELVDDGLATTPAKTAATLRGLPDASVVLVAGGEQQIDGRAVHASPDELALLEQACIEVSRAARLVVCFGSAADRLTPMLQPERCLVVETLDQAIDAAGRALRPADSALVVSPMFPVLQEHRERIASALTALAAGQARVTP